MPPTSCSKYPFASAFSLAVGLLLSVNGLSTPSAHAAADRTATAAAPPRSVTNADLMRKLEALEAQNQALTERVQKLETQQSQQARPPSQAQLAAPPQPAQPAPPAQVAALPQPASAPTPAGPNTAAIPTATPESASSTTIGSYGEIGYTRPTKDPSSTNVSVGRAVILLGHQFDETTRMYGEFEWENAITSSTDHGEAEVEQLFVEHRFNNGWRGTAGLYLMPVGLINQYHEPTSYYGVFRPDVDMKIIPSTWREVGLGLSGNTEFGLAWDAGITTAPNLSKWDPTTNEGIIRGPLQAIHGEGQFAAAHDLAVNAALNWRSPGVLLGASVFAAKIGQDQPQFQGNNSKLLLWDVHSRYSIADWEFAGEYVRGTLSNTEALNTSYTTGGLTNPTLAPSLFWGGYVEAAYTVWRGQYFRLTPFTRYEIYNTAAAYGSLGAAQGAVAQPDERLWTIGASFFIGSGVVLKADYRHYDQAQYPSAVPPAFNKGTSINLGAGYYFSR